MEKHQIVQELNQDFLAKRREEAKAKVEESVTLVPIYLTLGGLAHMVQDAQRQMVDLPKSKLWEIFGAKSSVAPYALKWVGYGFAALSLAKAFLSKQDELKLNGELATLMSPKITLKNSNSNQSDNIITEDSCNEVQHVRPIIQCGNVAVSRLQEPSIALDQIKL